MSDSLRDILMNGGKITDITVVYDPDNDKIILNIEVSRPVNRFKMTLRVSDDDPKGEQDG